ncbi:hypothetical protein PPBDW_I21385 [Photobacterium kishitanii]|nr:hypothetical protein PPBDW_I21385 [Photobacterium kishitanii]
MVPPLDLKSIGDTQLLGITLHDISNIYLYNVIWACPTIQIGVSCATHILICYVRTFSHLINIKFGLFLRLLDVASDKSFALSSTLILEIIRPDEVISANDRR